jgi:hypothetical protein
MLLGFQASQESIIEAPRVLPKAFKKTRHHETESRFPRIKHLNGSWAGKAELVVFNRSINFDSPTGMSQHGLHMLM